MLFRFNEWKDNNLNILVTYYYVWSLVYQSEFPVFVTHLLFLILLFTFIGSLGYYFNDICDIEKDRLVNKVNRAKDHSILKRSFILSFLVAAIIALWYFFSREPKILALILLEFLLIFTYSSPLARFKERPVLSVINDSFAAQVNLSLILLFTVSESFYSEHFTSSLLFLSWVFIQGVKWITGHHLKDVNNDVISSTYTSVTKYGFRNILLLNKVVLPSIEIVLFSGFLYSANTLLLLFYILYLLYTFLNIKSELSSFLTFEYNPVKDLGYRILNLFYVRYLGIIALSILAFQSYLYAYILLFHLIFFYKNTIHLYQDTLYRLYRIFRYLPLIFNYMLYYTFLIFGINLKQFNDHPFFEKLLLIKNSKIRKPYGQKYPPSASELQSHADVIIREWKNYVSATSSHGQPIDQISKEQTHLNEDKKWKSYFLYVYGELNADALKHFPETIKLIQKWKNEVQLVFFSHLEPGKHIPAHHGNNHSVIRTQIGIDIPEPEKTGLRVADKTVQLREKEIFTFDDTFEHEAWNNGNSVRTVIIIDTCKKFPYFYHIINRFQLKKIKNTSYVKSVLKQLNG